MSDPVNTLVAALGITEENLAALALVYNFKDTEDFVQFFVQDPRNIFDFFEELIRLAKKGGE